MTYPLTVIEAALAALEEYDKREAATITLAPGQYRDDTPPSESGAQEAVA